MGDDWFGHRNVWTFEPEGDKDEWTEWDYLLSRAFQTVEDWTDSHGLLKYEVDDPKGRVYVEAVRKIDKFEEAKEAVTGGKNYKPKPGEYFIPRVEKRSEEWPTMQEFIENMAEKGNMPTPNALKEEPPIIQQ